MKSGVDPLFGLWNEEFPRDIRPNYLFTCSKRLEVVGTLVLVRDNFMKQLSLVSKFILRSLMRAVALRLMLELILFIKLYHTSD